MKEKKKVKAKRRRVPPARNQGIVISGNDPVRASYAEITKKLKANIDLDAVGVEIKAIRKMKAGVVSMSVGRGQQGGEAAKKLRVAIEVVFGADTGVQIHSNSLRLHVLGICGDDDPADIRDGFIKEVVPSDQVEVRWTRPDRGGNIVAAFDVTEHAALRLLKKGRIKVGLISCRVPF